MPRILLCEDNLEAQEVVRAMLQDEESLKIDSCATGSECLEKFSNEHSVVLLDLGLPDISGLEVLRRLKNITSDAKVIVITASEDVGTAVTAMREGAHNYLKKPFKKSDLKAAIREEINSQNKRAASEKREDLFSTFKSNCMKELLADVKKFSPKSVSVIIYGKSGTGKEELARYIHSMSNRSGPFVAVNCPAIPSQLAESVLFGHERGSFTGADKKQIGKIVSAHTGTLFLDEVADLPIEVQAKLLRTIQEREVEPLGSQKGTKVDVRIISATSKNLHDEVDAGRFREDLLYRLEEIEVELPPLSARKEDISGLVEFFAEQYAHEHNERSKTFSPGAIVALANYQWPGNIRELKSFVRRSIIMADSNEILPENLDNVYLTQTQENRNLRLVEDTETNLAIKDNEKKLIQEALIKNGNNISHAAQELKIGRTTLYRKMKKYGLAS